MEKRIVTIGNLTIDDIVLYDSKEIFLESIGGNALYTAIGIKVWGDRPRIAARIGKNFPKDVADQFTERGIDSSLVPVEYNDIRNWALYEPGGARQFVNHLSSGTYYQMSITADDLPEESIQAEGIHIAPMPTDVQRLILKKITAEKTPNTVVCWDPHENYLSQPDFNRMAYEMLEMVDLFLPSKEEVFAMCGRDIDLYEAAHKFAAYGPRVVAIKMSTAGSLIYTKEDGKFYHVPIFESKTIDPTGAGDSYCGGFLTEYVKTGDAVSSACCGTVSASYVVENIGAYATLHSDFADRANRFDFIKKKIKKRK